MNKSSTILLVDMNSFFASVEQQCNPSLRGKPVLVGGSATKRSVVAAASYEARPYGIRSGMPTMEALERCPHAIVIEGDIAKYINTSHKVFQICGNYSDQMEIYSIDECFLDVTNTQNIFGGAWEVAKAIKRRIKADLGLTCSVGIGPSKMLAKLAAGMQKPDGLIEIKPDDVKAVLEDLPVEKLHGIGNSLQARLARLRIITAGDLGRASRDMLKREFGVMGEVLHDMGNGVYYPPVVPYHSEPDIKSVGHSYTMPRNTRDLNIVRRHLLRLSEMVGRRLRERGFAGRTVTLVVRYANMHTFTKRKSIADFLDDGYAIYQVASSILEQQVGNKQAIRLIGVCVSNLAKDTHQLNLFENPRWRALLNTMDSINNKYGEFTIKRACLVNVKAQPKTHGFSKEPL